MLHILILLSFGICKQIEYQFDASFQNSDCRLSYNSLDWISNTVFQLCNDQYIFGRGNMNSYLMRNIKLPPHYLIYIDVTFYKIDGWNSDKFIIYLDNSQIFEQAYSYTTGSQNLCGDSTNDEIIQISIQANHNSNFAVVYMYAQNVNSNNNESWGIKSFTLSIEPCPQGCDYCESNSYLYCKKWQLQYLDQKTNNNYNAYNYPLYQYYYYSSGNNQYNIKLPKHNKIMIRFSMFIHRSNDFHINILINNLIYSSEYLSNTLSWDRLFQITLPFFNHIENNINVNIQRIGGTQTYFDFKEFQLFIQKDDEQHQFILGCVSIIQYTCWECENGWKLVNGYQEIYQQGMMQDQLECKPNCGDFKIVGFEQCDDGNDTPYDGCHNCQYQCCMNCLKCVFGICQQCKKGYYLNKSKKCQLWQENNDILISTFPELNDCNLANNLSNNRLYAFEQKCYSLYDKDVSQCGDLIVQPYEQCDDGNNIAFDGCFNCLFQCNSDCLLCIFGICQQCQQEYFLTSNKTCEPICGDGIIVPYIEHCDDKNNDQGDGCYYCQLECFENCIKCNAVFCFQCSIGFKLIQNQCIPVCEDKIVLSDIEQCDDGNDEQYDGCYECKYQCKRMCLNCQYGVCQDKCLHGEIMINQKCISVCGNSIVTGQEECDDGNDIQYDGCYQCYYSCPLLCDYCEQGVCLECQQDYVFLNQQCTSVEICGNGLVSDQEECDDGNMEANDGCYKCEIEENWFCQETSPSQCQLLEAPKIILTILNYTAEIQYAQLSFSQKVRLLEFQHSTDELIKLEIINVPEGNSNITLYPIIPITSNLSQPLYYIQIFITQPLNIPYLKIQFHDEIVITHAKFINFIIIMKMKLV